MSILLIKTRGPFMLRSDQDGNTEEGGYQSRINVDIYQYPSEGEINSHPIENMVTVGDLHGNAAKFLHILIREDVVKLSKDDFDSFIEIYKYSDSNYKEKNIDLRRMINILNK